MEPFIGDLLVQVEKYRFQRKGPLLFKGLSHPFPCVRVCIGQLDEFTGLSQDKSFTDIGS